MKGQIFLIIAIITIVALMMLRISLDLNKIMENKRYLESGLERQEFQNMEDEIVKSIVISSKNTTAIASNTNDFAKFARGSLTSRGEELNGFLVHSIFPTVVAGTDTRLNVTVLNILGTEIVTLNLSLNSSSQMFYSIPDSGSVETNFTFTTSSNANYTLTAYYLTAYENKTEEINIPAEIGKSKYVGFFDLRLISSRLEQRDRLTKTYTLSYRG